MKSFRSSLFQKAGGDWGNAPRSFMLQRAFFWKLETCAPQRSNADTAVGSGFCEAKVLVFTIEKGSKNLNLNLNPILSPSFSPPFIPQLCITFVF
jgi:hypothetical protein